MQNDKPQTSTMKLSIHDSSHQANASAPKPVTGFPISDSNQRRAFRPRFCSGRPLAGAAVCALALLTLITACQSPDQRSSDSASPRTTWPVEKLNRNSQSKVTQRPSQKSAPSHRAPTPKQAEPALPLIPITESRGIVVLVNTQSQFIVADFSFNPLPAPGQRLTIFRNGQRVGEAKTTAFARGSLVAADILSGEARLEDEVRAE